MNANLSKNVLKYKPFPSSELRQQFSKLSISSIAYCVEEAIENTVCTISCNFIQSEMDEDSYIESYEVPLQSFLLNTTHKIITFIASVLCGFTLIHQKKN